MKNQPEFGFVLDTIVDRNTRFYRGNSMKGTFCAGDRLIIMPVPLESIIIGDVIVYQKINYLGGVDEVVHRVVDINESGILTRGDNNLFYDLCPVQVEKIVGKVVAVEGKEKKQIVWGGNLGLWKAKLRWFWLRIDHWFRWLFRNPYHWLRSSKIVLMFWQVKIEKVNMKTELGLLVKYVCNGRTVATWEPSHKRFDCRKPFDLVIFPPEDLQ